MERCPTCNAKYKGSRICYRCKTDLGALLDIRQRAASRLERAATAFASEDFDQMFSHAKRACALHRTPEASKMLACAALLAKKYDDAAVSWAKHMKK
ncbi:MAG: hypothetical protein B6245_15360 [Desulfobacteraceae bacterium 4572_88]|nr:MAG: hypothetical protein B6245_15360 [Desulfobacteraceae bacterium 4572_88]